MNHNTPKIMKKLLLFLLALPILLSAQPVQVPTPCIEGNAFTISIPFRLPSYADTVWYKWYYKGKLVDDTARVATHDNRKIAYTIPADSAYGVDVEAYFDFRLNDCCDEVWTKSPVYVMTFLPCLPPQASAITGETFVCTGTTGLTYSVANVSGVTYAWTVTGLGWSITAGQNSNIITVNAGTANGNISVTPSNTCDNGAARTLAVSTVACGSSNCSGINTPGAYGVAACSGVTNAGTISVSPAGMEN